MTSHIRNGRNSDDSSEPHIAQICPKKFTMVENDDGICVSIFANGDDQGWGKSRYHPGTAHISSIIHVSGTTGSGEQLNVQEQLTMLELPMSKQ